MDINERNVLVSACLKTHNDAALAINEDLQENPQKTEELGYMTVAMVGPYTHITGDLNLDDGKKLNFNADMGGWAIGGGTSSGTATFHVPLDEVLRGSVLTSLHYGGIAAGGCVITWSRDLKPIGTFVGRGFGVGVGSAFGSGKFKIS